MRKSHEPRISAGCSLHAAYTPAHCPMDTPELARHGVRCGPMRVVDCCEQADERDVLECARCGWQYTAPCNFDDEMS